MRKTPLMQRIEVAYGGRDIADVLNGLYLQPNCRSWAQVAARIYGETGIRVSEHALYPWLRRIRSQRRHEAVA